MKYFGIFATVIYVTFVSWLLRDKLLELDSLPLNEIGDFCAGVFGPITFFWMILGFIMQTQELKHSTRSLELQAEELSRSVEQQKEMVRLMKDQVDREMQQAANLREKQLRAAQIRIEFLGNSGFGNCGGEVEYSFQLRNSGSSVTSVSIRTLDSSSYSISPTGLYAWDFGVTSNFKLKFVNTGQFPRSAKFEIEYIDALHEKSKKIFIITADKRGNHALALREITS
ncbi:hypothetical protein [Photobacterium damselae]|uniref:hypothetical protein n=1 Tax=Photobacterium damselae TaxID=38293 RepID=UPI0040675C08